MIDERKLIKAVEEEIKGMLSQKKPKMLYDMMSYHLGWLDHKLKPAEQYKGKRFRPLLCLLTYNSLSHMFEKAVPVAAAIELIHNFSLIHDDIEDRDEMRRHRPTVWKVFGIPHAINAGDGMHVLSNLAALRLAEKNVAPEKVVEILKILNETVMKLCEGQYLDMSFESANDVQVSSYIEMIEKKTAALIEASCHTAAILGTEDEKTIAHFCSFGKNIGIAFQIADDILGVWGKEEKTGKPETSDIEKKKKSLPIIYAFENSSRKDREALSKIYRKEKIGKREKEEVMKILNRTNARAYCKKAAKSYKGKALPELKRTGIKNEAVEKMRGIAKFLVEREF